MSCRLVGAHGCQWWRLKTAASVVVATLTSHSITNAASAASAEGAGAAADDAAGAAIKTDASTTCILMLVFDLA